MSMLSLCGWFCGWTHKISAHRELSTLGDYLNHTIEWMAKKGQANNEKKTVEKWEKNENVSYWKNRQRY